MAISHRSHRLRLVGSPGVQQLHGGRYRLTFKLVTSNPREDWYNANKSNIFADYGSLQSTAFDTNGVESRTGEAYDDMLLVKAFAGAEGDGYSVVFVYETLTDNFVNESEDKIDFELNGLKRVVRTRIAKSNANLSGTIGTTTASATETDVILAQREDAQLAPDEGGFRRVVETYMQKGVLLVDVNSKYGTKAADATENEFQIATVKVIGLSSSEAKSQSQIDASFALFDQAEENVEGLSVFTYRFTKGSGEIARTTSTEGLVTNVVVTSVNEAPDDTDIGIITKTDVQAREDALIYTYTFSSGEGTLETKTSSKYNGTLTITTVRSLNTVPSVPAGAYQVSASSEVNGVFTIHTITYASGTGQIGISEESKYDGALTITTKTSLNEVPTMSATTISTDVQQGDYGQIYVYKFASGSGEIGSSEELKYDGALTITTKTNLNSTPSMSAALISSSIQDTDFGQIYTYKFASGSGEIGESIELKYNNALTVTTKTSLNEVPSMSATLISSSVQDTDFGQIYTYKFAEGSGQIGVSVESKYNGALTITTKTSLNEAPTMSAALISTDVQSTDFGQIYIYKFASGSGQIGKTEEKKYNNQLTLTTVTNLNIAPSENGALIRSQVDDTEFGQIFRYTYASGVGKVSTKTQKKYNDKLTITTDTHLNEAGDPGGNYVMSTSTESTDFGELNTIQYASGTGEISKLESTKYNDVIDVTTRVHLNEVPQQTGTETILSTSLEQGDFGEVHTITSYTGEGKIQEDTTNKYNDELTITTLSHINDEPPVPATAYLMRTEVQETEYGEITRKTFAEGEGEIKKLESKKHNDVITVTTRVHLNEVPETTDETIISTSIEQGDFGEVHTITSYTGEGEIQEDIQKRYDDKLTITTLSHINDEPTVPATAYLTKTETQETEYGLITRKTFAEGEGKIEESETVRIVAPTGQGDGEVTEKRERHLNITTDPTDPTGYTLVGRTVVDGDFGNIIEFIWIKGDGQIRKTEETRNDGSIVTTIVRADTTEPTSGDVSGSIGTDTFLVSTDVNTLQGYSLTTYKYYGQPDNYQVPFSTLLNRPDEVVADSSGVYIGNPGSSDAFTGTTYVSFHKEVPEVEALSDLEPSLTVVERAVFADGSVLSDHTTFRNAYCDDPSIYYNTATNTTFLYREKPATLVDVDGYGSTTGNPFTGTLTVIFEVVPYLTVGGVTIYKKTKSTVSLSS